MNEQATKPKIEIVKTFIIRHDFAKSQPVWTTDKVVLFGEKNEGFEIEARDESELRHKLKSKFNLNPFYVKWDTKPEFEKLAAVELKQAAIN